MKFRINNVDLFGEDIVHHLTIAPVTAHCFADATFMPDIDVPERLFALIQNLIEGIVL